MICGWWTACRLGEVRSLEDAGVEALGAFALPALRSCCVSNWRLEQEVRLRLVEDRRTVEVRLVPRLDVLLAPVEVQCCSRAPPSGPSGRTAKHCSSKPGQTDRQTGCIVVASFDDETR